MAPKQISDKKAGKQPVNVAEEEKKRKAAAAFGGLADSTPGSGAFNKKHQSKIDLPYSVQPMRETPAWGGKPTAPPTGAPQGGRFRQWPPMAAGLLLARRLAERPLHPGLAVGGRRACTGPCSLWPSSRALGWLIICARVYQCPPWVMW